MQWVKTFIDTDKAFPCLTGAGSIVITTYFACSALDVIYKLNMKRPDKSILFVLDTFLFFGFLTGFFFRCLPFGDSFRFGSGSFLFCSAFSVNFLRLENVTHIHVKSFTVKIHLCKMSLDYTFNLCKLGVQLIIFLMMCQPCTWGSPSLSAIRQP